MNRIDLETRVAVVTGGAQGIGAAIAERLARSGARVAIWDVDGRLAAETAGRIGGDARAVDITDAAAVEQAVAKVEAEAGGIDILVNSAGIAGPNAPVAEYPVDAWRRIVELNLTGTFLVNRAVVPGMQARNYPGMAAWPVSASFTTGAVFDLSGGRATY